MIAVICLGMVGAVASVYFRRTQLEKTREFWGEPGVLAFQLAPIVKLEFNDGKEPASVDLTGTPGLGHLRHALLEQRHYEWDTQQAVAVQAHTGSDSSAQTEDAANPSAEPPKLARLTFSDPRLPAELPPEMPVLQPTTVVLELNSGWVGPAEDAKSVRLNERARPAVKHFLTTMRNVKQARYDDRPDG